MKKDFHYSKWTMTVYNSAGDRPFIEQLPPEILVKIFQCLTPREVFLSINHVNRRWRQIVQRNTRRLPLIPVHCKVDVMDMEGSYEAVDGTHPMIQYMFSVYDPRLPEYHYKLRQCRRGNGKWANLWVTHRMGEMIFEWERSCDDPRPSKTDSDTGKRMLSYMVVKGLRFDVRKQGRKTVARMTDDRFAQALDLVERVCGRVQPRALLMSSKSPYFPWCLAPRSQKKFASLRNLTYLVLENMPTLNCFGTPHDEFPIDLATLKNIHLKFDTTHKQEVENIIWIDVDGQVLRRLLDAHQRNLDFAVYPDVHQAISVVSAEDMVEFIRGWRRLMFPWPIKNIQLNTTISISEFRTVATRMGMYAKDMLQDVPYCRFRTFHPSEPNFLLELACYGNGFATQWSIHSGYPIPKRSRP